MDNLVKFKIYVGSEFSGEEILKIINEAEFQKSWDKILRFASVRPRSKKEFEFWLKRKEIAKEIHKKLFDRLNRIGYLDDCKFAKWWVDQRITFRNKSIKVIKMELLQKGIEKDIVDQVLAEQDIDEIGMAKSLLQKKMPRWKNLDEKTRQKKASEFLMRKGFSWDVLKSVLNKISVDNTEFD